MSVSSFDLLPTFQQETNFLPSTNKGCESSGLRHIQSTVDTACSEHSVDMERLRDTSEGIFTT